MIDSHQRFWQQAQPLERKPIRRRFLPEDIEPLLEQVSVDQTVFVQQEHSADANRWAFELAEKHAFIGGIVAWADLGASDFRQQFDELHEHPKFVGVTHRVDEEADDDFVVRDDVLTNLKVLEKHRVPFDLLFQPHHLKHAATLGRELPELPMVIDHLARPPVKSGKLDGWAEDIKAAAACDQMYCKLSGLITQADSKNWTVGDLRPYVHTALEAFGPERCMFGSDWPICELAATYQQTYQGIVNTLTELSHDERMQILGKTAARFYNLKTA